MASCIAERWPSGRRHQIANTVPHLLLHHLRSLEIDFLRVFSSRRSVRSAEIISSWTLRGHSICRPGLLAPVSRLGDVLDCALRLASETGSADWTAFGASIDKCPTVPRIWVWSSRTRAKGRAPASSPVLEALELRHKRPKRPKFGLGGADEPIRRNRARTAFALWNIPRRWR
jgi:hypothetical protein